MGRGMIIMARFVPKDKLSKKAQKAMNRQRRVTWNFSPVTKTVDSKKLYNRKRSARNRDDDGQGDFLFPGSLVTEPVSSKQNSPTVCRFCRILFRFDIFPENPE